MSRISRLPPETPNTLGARPGVLTWYIMGTLQGHGQSNCIIPTWYTAGTLGIFQANFLAVFPEGKYSVHLRCPRQCDCDIPIRKTLGTLKVFPKNVPVVFSNGLIRVFLAVFQPVRLQCSQPGKFKINQIENPKMFPSGTFKVSHQFSQGVPHWVNFW